MILILLTAFPVSGLHPESEKQQTRSGMDPDFDISFGSTDYIVNTRDRGSEPFHVNGTIMYTPPGFLDPSETCALQVYVESDEWEVSTPERLYFSNEIRERKLEIRVKVPYINDVVTKSFKVTGYWNYSLNSIGGSIKPVTVNITTMEFIDVYILARVNYNETESGKWVNYKIEIFNNEDYDVNLTLTAITDSDSIEIVPNEVTVHLLPKEVTTQNFSVRKIKGWSDRDFIEITGSCEEGELFRVPEEHLVFDTTPKPDTMRKAFLTVAIIIAVLIVLSTVILVLFIRKFGRKKTSDHAGPGQQ